VAALHAIWLWHDCPGATRRCCLWAFGFLIGVLPYMVGYWWISNAVGGVDQFFGFIAGSFRGLDVANSSLSLIQRANLGVQMIRNTLMDVGPTLMMLHAIPAASAPLIRIMLLIVLPATALATALGLGTLRVERSPARTGLIMMAGFALGFFALVLAFGDRLWFQHAVFMLLVPYLSLAFALEFFVSLIPRYSHVMTPIFTALLLPLLATNLIDRHTVFEQLRRTGGVGLASDAIVRFAEDSLRNASGAFMFFPDWGVFMPFLMITHGQIPYATAFDAKQVRRILCDGHDAIAAFVEGQSQSRVTKSVEAVDWTAPRVTIFRQRDGVPVLSEARWLASERPVGAECP